MLYCAHLLFVTIIRTFSTLFVTQEGIVQNSGHFYLYGESYKSEIRTLSTAARRSILSIVGEYVSLAILLIVDFEIPVKVASCRADTFLLYIISANNIFILILFSLFYFLFKENFCFLCRIICGYYTYKGGE